MMAPRESVSTLNRADVPTQKRSALDGAPLPRTTLLVLLIGLLASVLFMIVYVVEGALRPGYNAWQQPVSALSLGPGGWMQQVNFIVFGAIILCTIPAIHQVLQGGVGAFWYPLMRTVQGISFILLGFFSQDPTSGYPVGAIAPATASTSGAIHVLFSFVSFIALTVGSFIFARRFAKEPRWHGWATYSVINGLLAIACIALYGTLTAHHSGIAGIFERLPGLISAIWSFFLLMRLFKIQQEGKVAIP